MKQKNDIKNKNLIEDRSIQINSHIETKNTHIIGSDEVGTGDVFGPVVVCSVLVTDKDVIFLKEIGVKDSKKLSKIQIQKIFENIKDKILYEVKIVSPSEYNELNKKNNLNKIKALCHNYVILEMLKKVKQKPMVVVDQFAKPELYFNYLKTEKKVYKDIIFETKAESKYLSVALASIIARNIFLKEIAAINKQLGINLTLGAGCKVDEQIKRIYQKNKLNLFQKIAKCNFKNIQKYF
ncbi:ribonuclease HIII, partial ['Camptotheca acuminata' phytoplasma]|uniref:ribonuclease HIII n=1 Tax='Camptotheca acuminata' phytoplasma TaxID=3239192 RepID=UPI00351A053B